MVCYLYLLLESNSSICANTMQLNSVLLLPKSISQAISTLRTNRLQLMYAPVYCLSSHVLGITNFLVLQPSRVPEACPWWVILSIFRVRGCSLSRACACSLHSARSGIRSCRGHIPIPIMSRSTQSPSLLVVATWAHCALKCVSFPLRIVIVQCATLELLAY